MDLGKAVSAMMLSNEMVTKQDKFSKDLGPYVIKRYGQKSISTNVAASYQQF